LIWIDSSVGCRTKTFTAKRLKDKAAAIIDQDISFHKLGDIFAEGGSY
jgi:hypothetical protein